MNAEIVGMLKVTGLPVDRYLGKETVQDIMLFRAGNSRRSGDRTPPPSTTCGRGQYVPRPLGRRPRDMMQNHVYPARSSVSGSGAGGSSHPRRVILARQYGAGSTSPGQSAVEIEPLSP